MKTLYTFLFLITVTVSISAQNFPTEARITEMRKLDYMIGQWSGTGWIEGRGGRQTFRGTETVQNKLNGLALLVEGKFRGKIPGEDDENAVIHETLAVISYDEKSPGYRFRTYLANGATGDYDLKLMENGWHWSIKYPGGQIRYTMKLTNKGEWFEIGEMSQDDGKSWRKFFEMTLQKGR